MKNTVKHCPQKFSKAYDNFNYLPMNRDINPRHVSKLVSSIMSLGMVCRSIICVNTDIVDGQKKKWVLDGQHLLHACARLDINRVNYVLLENIHTMNDIIQTMAYLNTTSKAWNTMDYVKSWSHINPKYLQLIKLYNTHDMTISDLLMILKCDPSTMKNGNLKFNNPDYMLVIKYMDDLFHITGYDDRRYKREVIRAFMKYFDKKTYNHQKFLLNAKKNKHCLSLLTGENSVYEFFKDNLFTFIT